MTDTTNRWLDVSDERDTRERRERNTSTVGRIFQAISQNKMWQAMIL